MLIYCDDDHFPDWYCPPYQWMKLILYILIKIQPKFNANSFNAYTSSLRH
jgi:hypothetical protein